MRAAPGYGVPSPAHKQPYLRQYFNRQHPSPTYLIILLPHPLALPHPTPSVSHLLSLSHTQNHSKIAHYPPSMLAFPPANLSLSLSLSLSTKKDKASTETRPRPVPGSIYP
eukprot:TRINITY_DN2534_c0_g1_i2.p1 TRINITY_DN2534_c0_g1~~TRINITY_DN2534_c0_g1_i2.p1  ORF type:complete len:111 (-),score=2.38 TRINITY_DN2534_c0_g1_i2:72-404(-)